MSEKRLRVPKATRDQLKEADYLNKLSPKDREWAIKFYKEYYNGEFTENPIHPDELRKDCYDRNNASKRQLHSVSKEMLEEAERNAYKMFDPIKPNRNRRKYYLPADYDPNRINNNLDEDDEDENIE